MKNVLVTGATRGLGLAISRRLIKDGFRVLAAGRSETAELAQLSQKAGSAMKFVQLDLSKTNGIADCVREATRTNGSLYGLVNNAGIGPDGVLGTMHNTEIERVMMVNVIAPMILTKYVSRSMMIAREGRIINVSSIIASTGFSGLAAYAASKAALEGFTRSLARELGPLGITVNAVAPGFLQTAMTESLAGGKLDAILRRSPLGRLATVDDAAAAVSYFFSSGAAAVTGTILKVDAGSTA